MSKYNIGRLLDGSLESYYWLGFIAADGSFYPNRTRITMQLGLSDQEHLKKACEFLGKKYTTKYSFNFMDKNIVPKIAQVIGIPDDVVKTECIPILSKFDEMFDEAFISFFVGFVDGDGCIKLQTNRASALIAIKLYHTWENFLNYCYQRLGTIYGFIPGRASLNKSGYARVHIGNFKLLKDLKRFVVDNQLPVLGRKWEVIDEHFTTKDEDVLNLRLKIKLLEKYQVPPTVIAEVLNVHISQIYNIRNKGVSH